MSVDPQDYYDDDLNSPADTREEREGDNYRVYVFRPIWEPFNESARELTHSYIESLSLPTTSGKLPKYEAVVASLLQAIRHVLWKRSSSTYETGKPWFVGASLANDKLANFPLVGRDVISRTVKAFQENELLTLVEGSGRREFSETASGKTAYKGYMTMWEPAASIADDPSLQRAKFLESGRSLVQVNISETRRQRDQRKRFGNVRQKLPVAKSKLLFGQDFKSSENIISLLCIYWKHHPLVFPDGSAAASATRVFSDGRMDVGGRLYGRWTSLKSAERLKCKIDGQPIVSIDVSASQPTLLSALLGVPMRTEDGQWLDVYLELTGLGLHKIGEADGYEAAYKRNREIAKAVAIELIGTGNPSKARPSDELRQETSLTDEEWTKFRDRLIEAIPALSKLEPRYNNQGDIAGYINGPGFLSYHESEMMLITLEELRDQHDIPAYPVHDCLLVQEVHRVKAAEVFRETINHYCRELTGNPIDVALTFEFGSGIKRRTLGRYGSNIT